ncbi:MAG: hypothetical protein QGF53_05845, partial [Alphaproteobacteria bacterium]|nr:hypothetical protein [Alphaproteobacteria bacterium]
RAPDTNAGAMITLNHFTKFGAGDVFFFIDFGRELDGDRENSIYGEFYPTVDLTRLALGEDTERRWSLSGVAGLNLGIGTGILLPGLRLTLPVPGFDRFGVYVLAYETFRDRRGRDFRTSWQTTLTWSLPLWREGDITWLSLSGFFDLQGDRGGGQEYKIVAQPQLRFDIGAALFDDPDRHFLGTEIRIFRNKFGVDGAHELSPHLMYVSRF